MGNSRALRCASAAFVGLLPLCAEGFELNLEAGVTSEYTDNVALTADNETGEWIYTPQILVSAKEDGPSVTATANYDLARAMYQDNTYGDQTTATGTAMLTWRAVADRLMFDLSNTSTQTTINSSTQDVPTNQQVTNTTTAGTTVTLDGPANHKIDLRYDYAWVTAQKTDTDSRRQNGTVSYIIPLTPKRRIQLNVSYGDVNYDSSQWVDYVSKSGDLQFVASGDLIELDASVGYTVFDQEQQTDDVSGTTGNLSLTWHADTTTTVSASYARSIEDQSPNVGAGTAGFGQTYNTDNSGVATPYTLDAVTVGISTKLGHNSIDLNGYYDRQNYDDGGQVVPVTGQQLNQDTKGVMLGIGRALRPTLSAQIYGNYNTVDYKNDTSQDNYSAGLRLNWTRWRRLSVSASGEYEKRTSDIATQEYKAWTGTISLMYSLVGTPKR